MDADQIRQKFIEGFTLSVKAAGITDQAQIERLLSAHGSMQVAKERPKDFAEGFEHVVKQAAIPGGKSILSAMNILKWLGLGTAGYVGADQMLRGPLRSTGIGQQYTGGVASRNLENAMHEARLRAMQRSTSWADMNPEEQRMRGMTSGMQNMLDTATMRSFHRGLNPPPTYTSQNFIPPPNINYFAPHGVVL